MNSTEWQKSLRRSTGEHQPRSKVRVRPVKYVPKSIRDGVPNPKATKFRSRRVLSAVVEDEAQENFESEASMRNFKRKNSRKSSRPSLTDITNDNEDVVDHSIAADEDVFEKGEIQEIKAPRKKDQTFLLPIPSRSSTTSRSPSPRPACKVTKNALPEGVVCIDSEDNDGIENSDYSVDSIAYLQGMEDPSKWEPWRGWRNADRRQNSRAQLLDWIIEVVHYFKASQECLYQTVSLIDRYLSSKIVEGQRIQLVGLATILMGTKLEEYFFADIDQLEVLCQRAFNAKEIVKMEMDILSGVGFRTYSVDPMIFLNRCLKASLRSLEGENHFLYEAAIFFMDCIICCEDYWRMRTSKKAAAATLAALCLIPDGEGEIWTPTLRYYSGYNAAEIGLLSRQMLDLLMDAKTAEDDCGLRRKYRSRSRHNGFIDTHHCLEENIVAAISRLTSYL